MKDPAAPGIPHNPMPVDVTEEELDRLLAIELEPVEARGDRWADLMRRSLWPTGWG